MKVAPIIELTRWRIVALMARIFGVYLLLCAFWVGWQYALELVGDLRMDIDLQMKQDFVYNAFSLTFLVLGMGVLLGITWYAYGKALRPLRKCASRYRVEAVDRLLWRP